MPGAMSGDMTDALWLTTPWTDISGEVGQMDKTTVKFSIPMDNAISLRTVDDNGWFTKPALQERSCPGDGVT